MKKEFFQPYKDMLLRCIESCVRPDQLTVCEDLVKRFDEQFRVTVEAKDRFKAMDELSTVFLQKQAEFDV